MDAAIEDGAEDEIPESSFADDVATNDAATEGTVGDTAADDELPWSASTDSSATSNAATQDAVGDATGDAAGDEELPRSASSKDSAVYNAVAGDAAGDAAGNDELRWRTSTNDPAAGDPMSIYEDEDGNTGGPSQLALYRDAGRFLNESSGEDLDVGEDAGSEDAESKDVGSEYEISDQEEVDYDDQEEARHALPDNSLSRHVIDALDISTVSQNALDALGPGTVWSKIFNAIDANPQLAEVMDEDEKLWDNIDALIAIGGACGGDPDEGCIGQECWYFDLVTDSKDWKYLNKYGGHAEIDARRFQNQLAAFCTNNNTHSPHTCAATQPNRRYDFIAIRMVPGVVEDLYRTQRHLARPVLKIVEHCFCLKLRTYQPRLLERWLPSGTRGSDCGLNLEAAVGMSFGIGKATELLNSANAEKREYNRARGGAVSTKQERQPSRPNATNRKVKRNDLRIVRNRSGEAYSTGQLGMKHLTAAQKKDVNTRTYVSCLLRYRPYFAG